MEYVLQCLSPPCHPPTAHSAPHHKDAVRLVFGRGGRCGGALPQRAEWLTPLKSPQGVWNEADGFVLTDPVIHTTVGRRRRRLEAAHAIGRGNGKTDKGMEGVRLFFASHRCNALCRRLGLQPDPLAEA